MRAWRLMVGPRPRGVVTGNYASGVFGIYIPVI
jgi:hypothetical protein